MNAEIRPCTMEELSPLIVQTLAEGGEVTLPVTGGSMRPLLHGERDSVVLARLARPPAVGDVLLYRRGDGRYVLHRVVGVHGDGTLTLRGDGQYADETGVRPAQILATVRRFLRGGRALAAEGLPCRAYAALWLLSHPLRRALSRWKHRLG